MSLDLDDLLRFAANRQAFAVLERAVRESKRGLLPFVGAGLSCAYGLPAWTDFLAHMCDALTPAARDEVRALLDTGDHERVASALEQRLGTTTFQVWLEQRMAAQVLPGEETAASLLPRLVPRGPVITTNFDPVLETVFRDAGRPFELVCWGEMLVAFERALRSEEHCLLKLHGDLRYRRGRVLTAEDYARAYGADSPTQADLERDLPHLLRTACTDRTLLFLGCSLGGDRTVQLLRRFARLDAGRCHVALLPRPADDRLLEERRRLLDAANIMVLWYEDGEEHDDHGAVAVVLRALADGTRPRPPRPSRPQGAAIVTVAPGPVIGGERIGVAPELGGGTALLEVSPGEALGESAPVRLVPLAEIPPGVLVLGADLATRLGLDERGGEGCALRTTGFARQRAEEVELELTVERPLDEVAGALAGSAELPGRVLMVRGGAAPGIEVAGYPLRIRRLTPPPTADEALYEIDDQTRFSLFAPALRTSVDVVILADCSGSMAWNDIEDRADVAPMTVRRSLFGLRTRLVPAAPVTITRMEALKRALDSLLEVRLATPGRVSRIALVAFTERCTPRFPREGGMVEMDDRAPPELIQQFRDAVALLRPERAATDIGNALNHAAELLDRHGRPGNDRLIVLISDGADWKPRSGDDAGEVVRAVEEPVSLMEDLHQRMHIGLHALGISTEEIFSAWLGRTQAAAFPHPSAVPNHKLLEALVAVGGGDPTRTGDATVLADYLSGLGQGVSRRLTLPVRPAPEARLGEAERAALRRAVAVAAGNRAVAQSAPRRDELCQEVRRLCTLCNERAHRLAGEDLFRIGVGNYQVLHRHLFEPARSRGELEGWWQHLQRQLFAARDPRLAPGGGDYPVPGVAQALRRMVEVAELMVGRPAIADDDAAGWLTLQVRVLERLRDVLAATAELMRAPGPGRPPAVSPAGFLYVG
jgi:hypothetical protein